jgi:4-amino-4-deoxy-L-arabinose transferase-like glycosyltransferase
MRDKYSSNSNLIASLVLVVLTSLAILYFLGLDRYGLFDVDEAIFTQASVEMMESGNYVTPSYNGEPRYHKPPLIYWAQTISMKYLDVNPMAARLPSAILAFLTIVSFYIMLEGMTKNGRNALIATAVLGVSLSFLVLARAAVADMALIFFSLTASMLIMGNIFSIENRYMPSIIAGFLLAGGLLAKGPIALMLPAITVGCTVLFYGSFKHNLKRLNVIFVVFAMAVAFIPWVKLAFDQHGVEYFNEFILKHNLERYLEGFGNSHSHSSLYYVWVLLIGFFPWVLLLPSAIWQVLRQFRTIFKSDRAENVLPLIGLVWMVTVVVFFSFSATKLAHYIVPALPGAAILIAWRLDQIKRTPLGFLNLLWAIPFSMLFAGIFLAFQWIPDAALGEGKLMPYLEMLSKELQFEIPKITDPMLTSIISQDIYIGAAPIMIGAILLVGTTTGFIFLNRGHLQGVTALVATMCMAYTLLVLSIAPVAYKYMQQPLANIAEMIKEKTTDKTPVYFVSLHQPSVRFLSGVPFQAIDSPAQLKAIRPFHRHALLAVDENHVEATLEALPDYLRKGKVCEGGYCLIETTYKAYTRR